MAYEIEFTRAAVKAFDKLQVKDRRRLSDALDELERDPHSQGSRKIAGSEGLFRVRVGDYRIVYRVEEEQLVVLVVRLGHRKDVYRGL